MLEYLHLKNVGPAPEMQMELAPRLNLITGDNGLGKTFLLDIAWWVLTRTWARMPSDTSCSRVEEFQGGRREALRRSAYGYKNGSRPGLLRTRVPITASTSIGP